MVLLVDSQAIVRHEGSTSFSGHYMTNVRGVVTSNMGELSKDWRLHDDARVTNTTEADVLRENRTAAYLLFFVAKV